MDTYRDPKLYIQPLQLTVILFLITYVGFPDWYGRFGLLPDISILKRWFITAALLVAFSAIASASVTGSMRGILIDSRNRISLSRFQFLGWTLLVISALLAIAMRNFELGAPGLGLEIPTELLVAMGISTVSLVGSPAILSNKAKRKADLAQADDVAKAILRTQDSTVKGTGDGRSTDRTSPPGLPSLVVEYEEQEDARWAHIFTGDEVGTAAHVDLGKMQMFFFTFLLLLVYGAEVAELLGSEETIEAFPKISEGMNTLLGLSHTGYLANKTVVQSREVTT